jgi:hypothetical protein
MFIRKSRFVARVRTLLSATIANYQARLRLKTIATQEDCDLKVQDRVAVPLIDGEAGVLARPGVQSILVTRHVCSIRRRR